jgi:hypothetical protein
MSNRVFLVLIGFMVLCQAGLAQRRDSLNIIKDSVYIKNDSLPAQIMSAVDTSGKRTFSPRKAALRSAVLPGWGQIYNKKYWKLPLVYGALGVTAYAFNFNLTQYKRVQYAYGLLQRKDSANYGTVDADLQPFIKANATNDLRNYRNEYRKNVDYSVLVFVLFWGLNVVDATVDAHLKGFNVNEDLTLKLKPGFNAGSNTTGLSLVFDIHDGKRSRLPLP